MRSAAIPGQATQGRGELLWIEGVGNLACKPRGAVAGADRVVQEPAVAVELLNTAG
jgi:hypothetical protein